MGEFFLPVFAEGCTLTFYNVRGIHTISCIHKFALVTAYIHRISRIVITQLRVYPSSVEHKSIQSPLYYLSHSRSISKPKKKRQILEWIIKECEIHEGFQIWFLGIQEYGNKEGLVLNRLSDRLHPATKGRNPGTTEPRAYQMLAKLTHPQVSIAQGEFLSVQRTTTEGEYVRTPTRSLKRSYTDHHAFLGHRRPFVIPPRMKKAVQMMLAWPGILPNIPEREGQTSLWHTLDSVGKYYDVSLVFWSGILR